MSVKFNQATRSNDLTTSTEVILRMEDLSAFADITSASVTEVYDKPSRCISYKGPHHVLAPLAEVLSAHGLTCVTVQKSTEDCSIIAVSTNIA